MAGSYLRRLAGQAADLPRLQPVLSWPRAQEPVAAQRSRATGAVDRTAGAIRPAGLTSGAAAASDGPRTTIEATPEPSHDPAAKTTAGAEVPAASDASTELPGTDAKVSATDHAGEPAAPLSVPPLAERGVMTGASTAPADVGPAASHPIPTPAGGPPPALAIASSGGIARRMDRAPAASASPMRELSPVTLDADVALQQGGLVAASVPETAGAVPTSVTLPASLAPATGVRPRRVSAGPVAGGTVVRVGTIEVVVDGPPAQPLAPTSMASDPVDAAPASSLARGYRSAFGLRQG